MISDKKAHSVNELVKNTGLGKTNLYQLIKDGELKAKKLGKRTLVLDSDLNEFLNNLPDYKVGGDA